jgi:hypothetical protein
MPNIPSLHSDQIKPLNQQSFEQIAKEFCKIVRMALREHSVTIQWFKERMEEREDSSYRTLAASHRDWAPLVGRILAASVGICGSIGSGFIPGKPTDPALQDKWALLRSVVKTGPKLGPDISNGGTAVYENYATAERTELDGSLKRAQRIIDDTSHKLQTTASSLNEFLETIRHLNEELAQSMRAMRG